MNASTQADDPRSILSLYRALIRLRRDKDVLSNDDRDWHRPWIIQPGEPCPTGTSASVLMSLIRPVANSAASNSNVQRSCSASDRASRFCNKQVKQLRPVSTAAAKSGRDGTGRRRRGCVWVEDVSCFRTRGQCCEYR